MEAELFWTGLRNSVVRTALGWTVNIFFTVLAAYPLSKSNERFKHRTFFAWFFFLPMIINGGLIPNYILVKELGLIDNILALVLPMAVPVFYVLVMLNFFRNLPIEMEESALLDGASQWRILLKIYIPLSLPAFETITVYVLVMHWNFWFDGLIYMNDPKNYPLMTYLQTAVLNIDWDNLTPDEAERLSQLGGRTYNAAQMFLGAIPIILTYPFLQKYFVKGLVLGGVKG
jgi:putative aldouronate transport system permease protein